MSCKSRRRAILGNRKNRGGGWAWELALSFPLSSGVGCEERVDKILMLFAKRTILMCFFSQKSIRILWTLSPVAIP